MAKAINTFNKKVIELARNSIIELENELRVIIDNVLKEKAGFSWLSNPSIGFSKEYNEQIEKIMENEKTKNKNPSSNILDYCYIHDLKELLLKNWNDFSYIFKDKSTTESFLNLLEIYRNPCMHGRKIELYKYHLAIGICNYLLDITKDWKKGYKIIVTKYECYLTFMVQENIDDYEKILQIEFKNWIKSISQTNKIEEFDDKNSIIYKIKFNFGNIVIEKGKKLTPRSYSYPNSLLGNIWCQDIFLKISNKKTLQKLIECNNHPYWYLRMILKNKLNLKLIKQNMSDIGVSPKESGHKLRGKEYQISSLTLSIAHFRDTNNCPTSIECTLGSDNDFSYIELTYLGNMDKGFVNAHNVNLEKIFDMLYNKAEYNERKKLLESLF